MAAVQGTEDMSDTKVTIQTRDKVVGMKKTARLEVVVEGEAEMVKGVEAVVRKAIIEGMSVEDE